MNRRLLAAIALAFLTATCVFWSALAQPMPWGIQFPSSTITLGTIPALSSAGGSINISGVGFTPTTQIKLCYSPCGEEDGGTWLAVGKVTYTSSSLISLTTPALPAGTYDLLVDDIGGNRLLAPASLVVTATKTPSTIFGSDLRCQWIPSSTNVTLDAGAFISIADTSGNSNTLTVGAGYAIYNPSSSTFSKGLPSITLPGSGSYIKNTAATIGSTGSLWFYGGVYTSTGGSLNEIAFYHIPSIAVNFQTNPGVTSAGVNTAIPLSPSYVGVPFTFVAGHNFFTTSAWSHVITVDNSSVSTAVAGGDANVSASTGFELDLGGDQTASSLSYEFAEIGCIDRAPTATEEAELITYLNLTYGIDPPPVYLGATVAPAHTSTIARIGGNFFQPGVTVTAGGGMGSLTVLESGTKWIDVSIPSSAPGSYDLTITNPDGQTITQFDGLEVQTGLVSPMTIFGTLCIGWWQGNNITCSGTCVSDAGIASVFDQSWSSNTLTQSTGADQPNYNVTDSKVGNQPSWTNNGSTQIVTNTSVDYHQINDQWLLYVAYQGTQTGTQYFARHSSSMLVEYISGTPEAMIGAVHATAVWGSDLDGGTNNVATRLADAGAGYQLVGINVSNGTEVWVDAGATVLQTQEVALGGSGTGGYSHSTFAIAVALSGTPTGAQLAAWETYVKATFGTQ